MKNPLISKTQIANAFGLSVTGFFRKIHSNSYLLSKLEEVGYDKRNKVLTPLQLSIICKWFGYPDLINE